MNARSKPGDLRFLQRSRSLRRNATDAESKLWAALRGRRLAGVKFRRQVVIGSFVADFCSQELKLVIELDGGQHADVSDTYDAQRTHWLTGQGYRVLRFWNNDVLDNIDGVLTVILSAVEAGRTTDGPN